MRTAEFDRESVLRNAMHAFMTYGYNKTSMPKLTEVTGLHPGSIYCAFKNKKGLLLAAIDQYQSDRHAHYQQLFENSTCLRDALTLFLDDLLSECLADESKKVCLLTKTLNEIGEQDNEIQSVLNAHLQQFESLIRQQFLTAWPDSEVMTEEAAANKARFFIMCVYGIRTYSVTQCNSEHLQTLADQVLAASL
ncbi:TetR/AcrR family transcriptional regulator [Pseudoalteromonas piscicida]|uniref:TetR family transcriptional regulator n=1 Tax=Pseudoalteromonas piscicida TaxID=43662 RepID=A0A2A5JRB4_PSEO7|nr:TetR/AcrR family transcriptional regulator [Pseudoalteromonas piscicida]PCK31811.1 TetR family transcriptional regulator [Pseudoalteromonas piscicida]